MALFQDVNAMVSAARPRPMGQPGHQSLQLNNVQDTGGEIGAEIGKGAGDLLSDMFDPKKVREQAQQTRELMMKMPDELKKQILSNPDVQNKFSRYYRFAPELFADAGAVMQDDTLRGKIAFVDPFRAPEEQQARAEGQQGYQQSQKYRKGEGEISETGAKTGYYGASTRHTEQETDIAATMAPLRQEALQLGNQQLVRQIDNLVAQYGQIKAQTQHTQMATSTGYQENARQNAMLPGQLEQQRANVAGTRAQTAATEGTQARAAAEFPTKLEGEATLTDLHKKQTDALNRKLDIQEESLNLRLEQLRNHEREDPRTKRILDDFRGQYQGLSKQYPEGKQYRQAQFSMNLAAMTKSSIVSAMGKSQVELQSGGKVTIPDVLTNSGGMGRVNNALDETFMAVQNKSGSMSKEDMDALFRTASDLYESTYGVMESVKKMGGLEKGQEAVLSKYTDDRAPAKMLYMQLMYERKCGVKLKDGRVVSIKQVPGDPDREKRYVDAIHKLGGLPTVLDTTPWASIFSGGNQVSDEEYQGSGF